MRLRNGERWNFEQAKKSLRESKQYDPELRSVYGKLLAEVYIRLDGAMQGFFRRVRTGGKPGFPRFKPRHQFFTLCYPAMYLEVQDKTIVLWSDVRHCSADACDVSFGGTFDAGGRAINEIFQIGTMRKSK